VLVEYYSHHQSTIVNYLRKLSILLGQKRTRYSDPKFLRSATTEFVQGVFASAAIFDDEALISSQSIGDEMIKIPADHNVRIDRAQRFLGHHPDSLLIANILPDDFFVVDILAAMVFVLFAIFTHYIQKIIPV
jgi:hypothetical protein